MVTNYYTNTSEDTIDASEMHLYNLIMEYRASLGLPSIPLSKSLTIVAGRHSLDQVYNADPVNNWGHNWSDAPYNGADPSTYPNMWQAPQRIGTEYTDNGFEISYGYASSDNVDLFVATPDEALAAWKNSPLHNDVITNQGPWATSWEAIGVGMHKGVAHVWFGRSPDPAGAPTVDLRVSDSGTASGVIVVELPQDLPDPDNSPFQIYRFFNTENGSHFYTHSIEERNSIISSTPTMQYEGNAFDSNAVASEGSAPVHRFYNLDSGTHFYTANEQEAENIQQSLSYMLYEGISYYVETFADGQNTPLYRFLNTETGSHFFTISVEERDQIIGTLGHFSYEGIAYYVDLA